MPLPVPPRRYLVPKPTLQTVHIGGYPLNLLAIAEDKGLDHGYLSRVLSGERVPSLPYLQNVCAILGWSMDDLLKAIDQRRKTR